MIFTVFKLSCRYLHKCGLERIAELLHKINILVLVKSNDANSAGVMNDLSKRLVAVFKLHFITSQVNDPALVYLFSLIVFSF